MKEPIIALQNEIVCAYRQIMGCDHDCQNCDSRLEDIEIINALEAAIEALKKQIPTKINVNGFFYAGCPNCNKDLYYKYPFCPDCGQALDWTVMTE